MTLAGFLNTWRGLTLENRLHRLALLGLVATNLTTAVALVRTERTLVLVPPILVGEVRIARGQSTRRAATSSSSPASRPPPVPPVSR